MYFTICAVGIWLLSTFPVSSALAVNPEIAQEPQLHADVILGILRFTYWSSHDLDEKFLNVCTLDGPIAEPALLSKNESHKVANRTLVVRVIGDNKNINSCDVIVCGPSPDSATVPRSILSAATRPILTICDGCNPLKIAATVRLVQLDNRTGFEIDLGKATKQGIRFSSSLLELASEVRR